MDEIARGPTGRGGTGPVLVVAALLAGAVGAATGAAGYPGTASVASSFVAADAHADVSAGPLTCRNRNVRGLEMSPSEFTRWRGGFDRGGLWRDLAARRSGARGAVVCRAVNGTLPS